MNRVWLAVGIAIASGFLVVEQTSAANPEHVRKLIKTNACKGCDLSEAQLSGLDFREANLSRANLDGANLSGTILIRANLQGANLRGASVTKADFSGANLRGADLSNAKNGDRCLNPLLYGLGVSDESPNSRQAQRCIAFSLLKTFGSKLCTPEFGYDKLREGKGLCTFFRYKEESQASLIGQPFDSFFQVTTFMGADLTDASLDQINLTASNFRYATLERTSLKETDLTYALLLDAQIVEVDKAPFSNAFVTVEDVKETIQKAIAAEKAESEDR